MHLFGVCLTLCELTPEGLPYNYVEKCLVAPCKCPSALVSAQSELVFSEHQIWNDSMTERVSTWLDLAPKSSVSSVGLCLEEEDGERRSKTKDISYGEFLVVGNDLTQSLYLSLHLRIAVLSVRHTLLYLAAVRQIREVLKVQLDSFLDQGAC